MFTDAAFLADIPGGGCRLCSHDNMGSVSACSRFYWKQQLVASVGWHLWFCEVRQTAYLVGEKIAVCLWFTALHPKFSEQQSISKGFGTASEANLYLFHSARVKCLPYGEAAYSCHEQILLSEDRKPQLLKVVSPAGLQSLILHVFSSHAYT